MAWPPVTVSILNYQGKRTIRAALEAVLSQDYAALEVMVVDNASDDGSDRIAEQDFSPVRLLRCPENIGCAARNVAVATAKGEIVVTLDNDVLLTAPDITRRVVEVFQEKPSLACVNFQVLDAGGHLSERDWCHPRDCRRFADMEFLTDYVIEGACAFRRSAFEQVGGYWAPLFLGHEGPDLALRLLDAGYDLLYAPELKVRHMAPPAARSSQRIYYTWVRNEIWIALRHHCLGAALTSMVKGVVLMAFASARAGRLRAYFRGLGDGVAGARRALATRRRLRASTYRRLASLRALAPSPLQKIKRHLRQRLV